jgi:hypothetical protein
MHESWSAVVESPLTNQNTVEEVLAYLNEKFSTASAQFVLRNQAFVDFIEDRTTGEKYNVMLPESEVAAFIENDEVLCSKPMGLFYQHTIRNINANFKFQHLTLKQLGIPDQDVLYVKTNIEEYYIELIN